MRWGWCAWWMLVVSCASQSPQPTVPQTPLEPQTAPIPVPQPAVPRTEMSDSLQTLWSRVEQAVDIRPPDPPQGDSKEAIDAWADGAFTEWLGSRQRATDHALEATYSLRPQPSYERAVGTALFAYLYEDMAGSIRGAPVAEHIAKDPELLAIYTDTLTQRLRPFADLAARAYYACWEMFGTAGNPAWGEWVHYCEMRGAEVVQTYELAPPEPEPNTPQPDEEDGASPTPNDDSEQSRAP